MDTGSATHRTLPFRIVLVQSRVRRTFATALAVVASCAGLLSSATEERDLFDELYARGMKQNAELKTLTASFTETSSSPLLVKPQIATGTVAVERPARVVLRYTGPDPRTVLIDGDRMTIAWPSAGIRSTRDISVTQRRIQKYFVDSSPRELRSHFDVTARDASDRPGTYLVTMVPKRKQIQEGITRLELWLDRASLLMSAMRMTFPGGDTKLMTFSEVTPNAPVEASAFTIR
jgi:outer membrane lipoprotein-sorting protein